MLTELPGRDDQLVDARALQRTIDRLRDARVVLPTFGQLSNPLLAPTEIRLDRLQHRLTLRLHS